MKTIVFQSFRTSNVPLWIDRGMQTVKAWAALRDYDYRFIDDRLFEYAPAWYRNKVANHVLPVTDLARLVLARELLAEGYTRTVWVDADVIVFDPDNWTIDVTTDFAFCREFWISRGKSGQLGGQHAVNNAVSVFVQGNSFLDFYIDACQSIVRHTAQVTRLEVGTNFLTALHKLMHLNLMTDVGLLSPLMMSAIVRGTEGILQAYVHHYGFPIRAANLCYSLLGSVQDGVTLDETLFDQAIDKLMTSRGGVVNRYLS